MKVIAKVRTKIEISTVKVWAKVRYWEDGTPDIPCRKGDLWCPEIDIDTGVIIGWPEGFEAKVYYKVCDEGTYALYDPDGFLVAQIKNNYVPNRMIPGEFGDYIIMTIDGDGKIAEWPENPDVSEFLEVCP